MNWVYLTAAATYLLGMLTSYASRIYSLVWMNIRIPPEKAYQVYSEINKHATWKFCLNDSLEPGDEYSLPPTEQAWMKVDGLYIYSEVSEKYLTAGHSGKEIQYNISYLRFNRKRLSAFIKKCCQKQTLRDVIVVWSTNWNYFVPVAEVRKEAIQAPVLSPENQAKIDKLIADFKSGIKHKAGFLLHGPPGNGKTSLIRSLAASNDWDVYIPIIKPESTNEDIIRMFMNIPKKDKAIIIFEDFDNVFHTRFPRNNLAKYSFEVILNILDGMYADLTNKIVVISTNYIDSVDDAIKNRPSRIDLSLKLDNPDVSTRLKLTSSQELADATEGMSYSTILELVRRGTSVDQIKEEGNKLETQNNQVQGLVASPESKKAPMIYLTLPKVRRAGM